MSDIKTRFDDYLSRVERAESGSPLYIKSLKSKRESGPIDTSGHTWGMACEALGTHQTPYVNTAERAAGIVLRLAIKHLYNTRSKVNKPHVSFVKALKQSSIAEGTQESLIKNLTAVNYPEDLDAVLSRIVSMISSTKNNCPFDYSQLFMDVLLWMNEEKREKVKARWIRDFYVFDYSKTEDEQQEAGSDTSV